MAQLKKSYLEETYAEIQTLINLWLRVRFFLQKALSSEPITKEEEQEFLKVKSDGTKYQRVLKKKLTDQTTRIRKLDFDYDKLVEILRSSISIGHLRSLPPSDLKALLSSWHRIYIQLCNIAGAYQFLKDEHVPTHRVKSGKGRGLKSLFQNKRAVKGAVIVVAVIALAAAAYYFEWI